MRKMAEKLAGPIEKFYRGVGCKKCRNTGYSGRIAIHELFVPTPEIREMISENSGLKKLRDKAIENGMVPLLDDGLEKVKAGITTVDEIVRVTEN